MIDVNLLTDDEIDELLEDFDQTRPQLKRRIIAGMSAKIANLKDANAALLAALKTIREMIDALDD